MGHGTLRGDGTKRSPGRGHLKEGCEVGDHTTLTARLADNNVERVIIDVEVCGGVGTLLCLTLQYEPGRGDGHSGRSRPCPSSAPAGGSLGCVRKRHSREVWAAAPSSPANVARPIVGKNGRGAVGSVNVNLNTLATGDCSARKQSRGVGDQRQQNQ
jgi:hypothetical protein